MVQLLYLIRHGETEWNREGRIQGHLDAPLTELGRAQARQVGGLLAELLDGEPPFVLHHSPLGRAARTTELILAELGAEAGGGVELSEVRPDDGLKEVDWGRWNGLTWAELAARDPIAWARREADRWTFEPPGGESYAMVQVRARHWLASVAEIPRLIAVGHGAFGRVLRGAYLGLDGPASLELEQSQDAIFRLQAGTVTKITTD